MEDLVTVPQLSKPDRVLIVGGGLGGLALAQGLKKAGIAFHVFEQDPTPDFRAQGYRLKLNSDGAQALRDVLPDDLWDYFEDTCAVALVGETNFNAIDGGITASRAGPGTRGGMQIHTCDRTVLRTVLLTGLENNISYGKSFVSYELLGNRVNVTFADGSVEHGKLLIGADGVRSKVRKQYLPNHQPIDTNGTCIYGKTPITPELLERFPERATRWMTLVLDQTPMTQRLDIDETPVTLLLEPIRFAHNEHREKLPVDYIYWVIISRTDVFGANSSDLLRLTPEQSAALSLKVTQEWHPSFRSLLHLQDIRQSSTLRVASAMPNMEHWESSDRITLLGDAIHVMSPCGGVGAVTALRDAASLAKTITEQGISKQSIEKYETTMKEYAKASIERSYFGGKRMFGQPPFDKCKALDL
jgi:prepilin-type processing-associated H-X9-DG protein